MVRTISSRLIAWSEMIGLLRPDGAGGVGLLLALALLALASVQSPDPVRPGVGEMTGENARVEIRTHGDAGTFWLVAYVNGIEVNGHVPVASIDDGSVKANRIDSLVRDVYRRAYRDGFKAWKEALGIAK